MQSREFLCTPDRRRPRSNDDWLIKWTVGKRRKKTVLVSNGWIMGNESEDKKKQNTSQPRQAWEKKVI